MSVRVQERLSSTSPCTRPRFHGNVLLVVVGFYCRQAAQQRGLSHVKRGGWRMKLFLNCSAVTAEACWRWTGSGSFFLGFKFGSVACCSKTCSESSERLVLLDSWVHSAVWELKYFLKLTKTKTNGSCFSFGEWKEGPENKVPYKWEIPSHPALDTHYGFSPFVLRDDGHQFYIL